MARCTAVRKYAFAVIASALALGAGVTPAYGDYTTPEDKELILTLCKHIAQSRAAIKSFRVQQEYETTAEFDPRRLGLGTPPQGKQQAPQGLRTDKRVGTYISKGPYYRVNYRNFIRVAGTNFQDEEHWQQMLAENFYALKFPNSTSLQYWEHGSLGDMQQAERARVEGYIPVHPLMYGFSANYKETLEERVLKTIGPMKWTVSHPQNPDTGKYIIVQQFTPERPDSKRRLEYVVDANRGYLITEINCFAADGGLLIKTTVTPRKLPDGIWFPIEVAEDDRLNASRFALRVVSVEVNTEIPDSEFSVDKFDFDPSTTVMDRVPANGGPVVQMKFVEGKWIPIELIKGVK